MVMTWGWFVPLGFQHDIENYGAPPFSKNNGFWQLELQWVSGCHQWTVKVLLLTHWLNFSFRKKGGPGVQFLWVTYHYFGGGESLLGSFPPNAPPNSPFPLAASAMGGDEPFLMAPVIGTFFCGWYLWNIIVYIYIYCIWVYHIMIAMLLQWVYHGLWIIVTILDFCLWNC